MGVSVLIIAHDAYIRDAETGQELVRLEGPILQATWSRDESRILTSNIDGTTRIWDAETGQELVRLEGHTMAVRQATWSRDESRILSSAGVKRLPRSPNC